MEAQKPYSYTRYEYIPLFLLTIFGCNYYGVSPTSTIFKPGTMILLNSLDISRYHHPGTRRKWSRTKGGNSTIVQYKSGRKCKGHLSIHINA